MKLRTKRMLTAGGVLLVLVLGAGVATSGGMWSPQPLYVHEWGVNQFDWSAVKQPAPDFPAYMYTDEKPGKPVPVKGQRTKDLPPDSGIRKKPILYFYPQWKPSKPVPVGVEVRFARGRAWSWWPQVNTYRTPAQVAKAKPVDWAAWKKKHAQRRWGAKLPPVPDDKRFELVWSRLELSKELPKEAKLPGAKLPADHWARVAREVDAWYVSNGKECERYVFYEGRTREVSAITILPPGTWIMGTYRAGKDYLLVNTGEYPIYDVFVTYRKDKLLWTTYIARLSPTRVPKPGSSKALARGTAPLTALRIPDFAKTPLKKSVAAAEFKVRTSGRLVEALSAGQPLPGGKAALSYIRDPADPAEASQTHLLYPKEAAALEKIWRKDFFESEGWTIVYRESPAYLNAVMPLNVYTNMYHIPVISRCGLVLNSNVPLERAKAVRRAISNYAGQAKHKSRAQWLKTINANRLMALGYIRWELARGTARYNKEAAKRLVELAGKLTGE
jgi:hypothetical protein